MSGVRARKHPLLNRRDRRSSAGGVIEVSEVTVEIRWFEVCGFEDLEPDAGVCALVEGRQIAIFYLPKLGEVFALENYDPFSHANVISRGLTGDLKGEPVVASPVYKHHFSLRTGKCLERPEVKLNTYPVKIENGRIFVGIRRKRDPQ